MYVPITTFNIGYPVERPWKRLPYYYSTIPTECKRKNKVFSISLPNDGFLLFINISPVSGLCYTNRDDLLFYHINDSICPHPQAVKTYLPCHRLNISLLRQFCNCIHNPHTLRSRLLGNKLSAILSIWMFHFTAKPPILCRHLQN